MLEQKTQNLVNGNGQNKILLPIMLFHSKETYMKKFCKNLRKYFKKFMEAIPKINLSKYKIKYYNK